MQRTAIHPQVNVPAAEAFRGLDRATRSVSVSDASGAPDVWAIHQDGHAYELAVASDHASRYEACRLAADVYKMTGYVSKKGPTALIKPFDANPDTLCLLVKNALARPVATITAVLNDPADGLPLDLTYRSEVAGWRERGRRLSQVVRLAVDPSGRHRSAILSTMIAFVYGYLLRLARADELFLTVLPRHGRFYRDLLGFEFAGPPRACPRARGTVGVLMHLDLHSAYRVDPFTSKPRKSRLGRTGTYGLFHENEAEMVRFLRGNFRPLDCRRLAAFDAPSRDKM